MIDGCPQRHEKRKRRPTKIDNRVIELLVRPRNSASRPNFTRRCFGCVTGHNRGRSDVFVSISRFSATGPRRPEPAHTFTQHPRPSGLVGRGRSASICEGSRRMTSYGHRLNTESIVLASNAPLLFCRLRANGMNVSNITPRKVV